MFASFKFKIGGFFSGWDEIQILQDKYDEDEYELNIESFFEIKFDMPKRVSPLMVQHFDEKLDEIGVRDWNKQYVDPDVLDGIQWELELDDLKCSGSNAVPRGFDDMVWLLTDLFEFPEQSTYEEYFGC